MSKLLLIDDEEDVRYSFQRIFDSPEIEFTTASSGEEGLKVIPKFKPDLVLMDIRMGGMNGLETLRRIRAANPKLLVILMTAYGTTQMAIEAMKLGAYDYLLKPFDAVKIKEIVGNALRAARDMKQVVSYQPLLESEDYELGIVGRSPVMQQVFKLIGQVAASDATALITGESGTGKELVARAIYHHSDRNQQPFLAVNCAAIPEQLLESELFGHERGAYTGATNQRIGKFEQCNHGTIFLDEIGDMTPATQTKILRVLQSGTFERVGGNQPMQVDVRVIAATNKPLEAAVAAKQFREDLFYRLNVVRLPLPPLRERAEDIPLLVNYFLEKKRARIAKAAEICGRECHSHHGALSLAGECSRTGKRHPPRPCHGQERRHSPQRSAAGDHRPVGGGHQPLGPSGGGQRSARGRCGRHCAPAFSMGPPRSQAKSHSRRGAGAGDPGAERNEQQPGACRQTPGHHPRDPAQTHRQIRHPARVKCEIIIGRSRREEALIKSPSDEEN